MNVNELKPNSIVRGSIFPEPVQVILITSIGNSVKLIGKGLNTGKVYEPVLTNTQLALLQVTPEKHPFDGDPEKFRLGVEAMRLGLAYEYDPYFSLSIARVDPLPHQLEAVYDYFLKLPRIRFLLADYLELVVKRSGLSKLSKQAEARSYWNTASPLSRILHQPKRSP